MGLNDIRLPASLIADLYKSSLVETNETKIDFKTKETLTEKQILNVDKGIAALGDNQKNISIIVSHNDVVHLPDAELNFLTGILGACKLSLGDVAIVNYNKHQSSTYKDVTDHFKSKIVLLFGIEPNVFGLPMSFPHFQPQTFSNCSFLFTPSLTELQDDKVLKSKLWVCLSRIFNV